MPADILLFALIAAGLVFWLRSILGTRDDSDEKKPGLFSDKKEGGLMSSLKSKSDNENNVVSLNAEVGDRYALPRHARIDNKTTENTLDDLAKEYPDFDLIHFIHGAEGAFIMIVEAFAAGDLEILEDLLAPEVYRAFKASVEERDGRGEVVETEIKNVEKIDITEARLKDGHLFMTVRFSAREVCVIRDREGDITSGDPDKTTMMVDVWVFGRDLKSDAPEWYLYETRDDEIEDHKTPIPEGGSDKEKK